MLVDELLYNNIGGGRSRRCAGLRAAAAGARARRVRARREHRRRGRRRVGRRLRAGGGPFKMLMSHSSSTNMTD